MNTLILLLAITVGADDSSIQQAFHKDVATGVVTAASAIRKERGATEAVKLLLQCLRDDDVELRAAAAHALGTMGDDGRRALPELIAALNNDEASEFAEALVKLGRGDISVWLAQAIIEPYQGIGDPYCALWTLVLGDGGKDERIVPILQKGLGHASFDVQWKAAALLGDIGPKAAPARQALVRLLEEEPKREKRPDEFFSSGEVRGQAACALGQIGAEPEQTAKLLTTMIRHSDPEIRTWSAVGLGHLRSKAKAAIPVLIACLADDKMIMKPGGCIWSAHPDHAAGSALWNIGPASIPAIIQAFDAKYARVRRQAANILWHYGEEAKPAEAALVLRLHDPDADVRCQVVGTLGQINQDAKQLVPDIVSMTQDNDASVRCMAAEVLEYVKPAAVVPTEPLVRLIGDPAPDVRRAALAALERVAPKATLESAIERLRRDRDKSVRQAANDALERLREK